MNITSAAWSDISSNRLSAKVTEEQKSEARTKIISKKEDLKSGFCLEDKTHVESIDFRVKFGLKMWNLREGFDRHSCWFWV